MKIIKHGKLKETKEETEFQCLNCGCVFIAQPDEYDKSRMPSFNPHGETVMFYCKCPECGEIVQNGYKSVTL